MDKSKLDLLKKFNKRWKALREQSHQELSWKAHSEMLRAIQNEMSAFSIGARIRKARSEKGIYSRDMANIVNVSRSTYSKFETGEQRPGLDTINMLSVVLEADLLWLITGVHSNVYTGRKPKTGSLLDKQNEFVESLLKTNEMLRQQLADCRSKLDG